MLSLHRPLIALLVSLLAACGGGGGGGGGSDAPSGSGTSGGSVPAVPGLVPAAPAPGAILYASAAELRPLLDGARWQYRGHELAAGTGAGARYTASVTQKATAGGVVETESLVFRDEETSSLLSLSAGTVFAQIKDPFGIGSGEVLSLPELRSPVRENDQYTLLERNGMALGGDVDGDSKADVGDVAIYARVIGQDSVELPELVRTVTAVRVETTALVRAKKSSDGSTMPVRMVVRNQWYLPGVGVVRRTLSAVSATGAAGPLAYDERLFSWDGVSQGLGALGPMPAVMPGLSPRTLLPQTLAAAVVGEQALVLAGDSFISNTSQLRVGVFDKRGALKSANALPDLGEAPYSAGTPALFGLDGNSGLLVLATGSSPGRLKLLRLDASGALQGSVGTLTVATGNSNLPMAWDGQALWLAWISQGSQLSDNGRLMLQPFSSDGQALAPVQVLDTPLVQGGAVGSVRLAAAAGRLLVSWVNADNSAAYYRYALVRGSAGTAQVQTLGTVARWVSPQPVVVPVVSSALLALQWNGPVFSHTGSGPLPETLPRGVSLDASAAPLRSTSAGLDEEKLPSTWINGDTPVLVQALGERLVLGSLAYQRAAPLLDRSPSDFALAAFVEPGRRPLATAAASGTSLSAVSGTLVGENRLGQPAQLLLWDDRALLIGNDGGRTMSSLFWLR